MSIALSRSNYVDMEAELERMRGQLETLAHVVAQLSARMDAMHGSKPSRDNGCRGHRPITEEDLIADGLTPQTAQEWLAHRRRRRAVLTPRAWEGIKAETTKAGWAIEDAVRKALARGWTGIEADWLARDDGAPRREARNRAAAAVAKEMIFGGEINGEARRI